MPVQRILTFDGGGQLELTSTLLIEEIEKKRPGFLRKTDILAGTSAGGMLSLLLATSEDPATVLPLAQEFWERFVMLSANSLFGTAMALFGMGALFSNEGLRGFLGQEQLLGEKTLADLKKKVMVTSFHLDGINKITGGRTWKPKVFHNTVQGDPDMREKAVDIALRTGAAPVFYPIVDGFVDGGLFANNPAMVALAQVAHLNRVRMMAADLPEARQQPQLHEVVLLSLGVGEDKAYVDVQSANWGYFPWVFNPLSPFILINALLQGDVMGVDFEAAQMMPADNYFRLNPYYARNSPIPGAVDTRQIKATVASQATQSSIDDVCQWLDKTGWMD